MEKKQDNGSPRLQGQQKGEKRVTRKNSNVLDAPETVAKPGDDGGIVEWPRVVEGHLLYQGKVKVGSHVVPVCEEASFTFPDPEDPEAATEAFAGYYDGNFPEITQLDVSSLLEIKAPMKHKNGRNGKVKAHLAATGNLLVGSLPQLEEPVSPEGRDLFAPYEQKLAKFMLLISSLSGNCAWYVLEDMRRLLYMRNGKVSRSGNLASRKEACSSLARLACLRKSLAEVEDKGRRFASHSSLEALLDLEASLAGSLAYRSADGKHPAVYIPVASLSPTSLYLHVTPAEFQRTLLGLFDRAWEKLGATSRRHGEKISHVAVVLDFSDLSQLDLAAYSTHRLLGDIGEVLRAYCPWLVYKIVIFKLSFAREFLWELFRPALHADCRVVTAEDEEALLQEIQADGTFILHTLGGFNEYSVLRCRRPAYRLPQPPQPLGASEWLSREGEATDFWEEMEKLYEEAPEAAPEGEPVDDIQTRDYDEIKETSSRRRQDENREEALRRKEHELESLTNRRECLIPHFEKALKQVLNGSDADVQLTEALAPFEIELTRPSFSMKDVTKANVQICMWKPPTNEVEAAKGTAQMLVKIVEERRKLWTHSSLPPNFMHAFERTTYPLDCIYHSRSDFPMKPRQAPSFARRTTPTNGLMRPVPSKENLSGCSNNLRVDAVNFL